MWELGAPTLCAVENLPIIYSQPSVSLVPPFLASLVTAESTNHGLYGTVVFTTEKDSRMSGLRNSKPCCSRVNRSRELSRVPALKEYTA